MAREWPTGLPRGPPWAVHGRILALKALERSGELSAGVPDFRKMTPEEVASYLERRRSELTAATTAAKAAGVIVPGEKKQPKDDRDKLAWLFERLGYQTGMRRWSDGRIDELTGRIEAVLKVSELTPEAVGRLLAEASEGYRVARIGTSFGSTSMPDKKEAKGVPTAEVFAELLGEWRRTLGPLPQFLVDLVGVAGPEERPPAEPSDREMFQKPTKESRDDSE